MITCQTVNVQSTDTVGFSDPSATSPTGCLKIRNTKGQQLFIFPPEDLIDAHQFLASLIAQAIELDRSVLAVIETMIAAA